MNAQNEQIANVKALVHVAYGCGCVRTFDLRLNQTPRTRCMVHGDDQISFTEEYRPPLLQGAA